MTASGGATVKLDWEESEQVENDPDSRAGHDLVIVGYGRIERVKHGPLVVVEATLSAADVASLVDAVRDPRRCCHGMPENTAIGTREPGEFRS